MHERSLSVLWRRVRETANLMVGLPDYEVMSRAEFVAERTTRRYEGGGSGRCC